MRELAELVRNWRARLKKALLKVENQRRTEKDQPLATDAAILNGPAADLYLLNLRSWMLRYGVSPEFILDALLKRWAKWQYKTAYRNSDRKTVRLHIPARMLGSAASREAVEDAVRSTYPNGEQWRMKLVEIARSITPMRKIQYKPEESDDEYIARHRANVEQNRKAFEKTLYQIEHAPRPYRRPERLESHE
jgi:hypothetical protein